MFTTLHGRPLGSAKVPRVRAFTLIRHFPCPSWRVDTADVHTLGVPPRNSSNTLRLVARGCTAKVCPRDHRSLTRNHNRRLVRGPPREEGTTTASRKRLVRFSSKSLTVLLQSILNKN